MVITYKFVCSITHPQKPKHIVNYIMLLNLKGALRKCSRELQYFTNCEVWFDSSLNHENNWYHKKLYLITQKVK